MWSSDENCILPSAEITLYKPVRSGLQLSLFNSPNLFRAIFYCHLGFSNLWLRLSRTGSIVGAGGRLRPKIWPKSFWKRPNVKSGKLQRTLRKEKQSFWSTDKLFNCWIKIRNLGLNFSILLHWAPATKMSHICSPAQWLSQVWCTCCKDSFP